MPKMLMISLVLMSSLSKELCQIPKRKQVSFLFNTSNGLTFMIEYSKGSRVPSSIMTDSIVPQANTKKVDFGSDAMQSLENAIRENNQEILYELIQKKIKDFFFKTDIDTMTREQLKVHTKMIAESVIDQFKSLKGATNLVLIQNRIDFIIGRLRHSKNMKANDNQFANSGIDKKTKIVVDYKSIEAAFIRNYQQSLQSIKEYRDHIKILNKKSYKLRNQLKPILKEVIYFQGFSINFQA